MSEASASAAARELPPPTFEFLVWSLRFQAEAALGLYPQADGSAPQADVDLARHTLDLMAMLEEKTRGNLTMEEKRLLENTLTELRFRFVQAAGASG
jgi:hypothetical protein